MSTAALFGSSHPIDRAGGGCHLPVMTSDLVHLYFDFVDPGSYLFHLQLKQVGDIRRPPTLVGMELALPPNDMVDPSTPAWQSYCDEIDLLARESGCKVPRVDFLPWSRKAHELLLHATHGGAEQPICEALFRAHFEDGRDLGRVDVLTEIAVEQGMDRTESKAVLDVDKYTEALANRRTAALAEGIVRIPTLRVGTESLVGPTGIHDLRILFESPGGPTTGT